MAGHPRMRLRSSRAVGRGAAAFAAYTLGLRRRAFVAWRSASASTAAASTAGRRSTVRHLCLAGACGGAAASACTKPGGRGQALESLPLTHELRVALRQLALEVAHARPQRRHLCLKHRHGRVRAHGISVAAAAVHAKHSQRRARARATPTVPPSGTAKVACVRPVGQGVAARNGAVARSRSQRVLRRGMWARQRPCARCRRSRGAGRRRGQLQLRGRCTAGLSLRHGRRRLFCNLPCCLSRSRRFACRRFRRRHGCNRRRLPGCRFACHALCRLTRGALARGHCLLHLFLLALSGCLRLLLALERGGRERLLFLALALDCRCLCSPSLRFGTLGFLDASALLLLGVALRLLLLALGLLPLLLLRLALAVLLRLRLALLLLLLKHLKLLCYELVLALQRLCLAVASLHLLGDNVADGQHLDGLPPQLRQPLLIALD
mmetsp:Transcript_32949/g.98119  ORF Transcript_32949/g.98119 Transcript_32949/m.98119 type:complete len:436 (+) Transcript_32949:1002-2309(+)